MPWWSGCARKVLDYDVYASHVVVCKLGMCIMTTTATLSSWLLVALTAQRAASVVWPHRVNVICTRHKSVVTIVVITAACSLLQTHTLYGFDLVKFTNGTTERCTFGSADYQRFWVSVWVMVSLLVYSPLPSMCLVVGNAVPRGWKLTVAIKEDRAKFSSRREDQKDSREKKASSVTVTIITVSGAFVLITVPLTTYNTFFHGYASGAIDYFLYDLFFVFGMSNFAWNFYLYCLTGSKFREEFKKIMFGCCMPAYSSTAGTSRVTEESIVSETGTRTERKRDVQSNNYDF